MNFFQWIYIITTGVDVHMLDIVSFYTEVLHLSDSSLIQQLTVNSKVFFVKKGEIIQNIGDLNQKIFFLEDGLLRGFLFDANGREVTDCFGFIPGTPAVSCLDLDIPTPICIEALEDSVLISIPLDVLSHALENNTDALNLYNRLLRMSLKLHWECKIMLAQYTATERYSWFLKNFPGLVDRISHKYIASFLGITPVQLSRIRRAIREQQNIN